MKKIIISFLGSIALLLGIASCDPVPTYYSQIAPGTFFDTQEKVYQRYARAFSQWAGAVQAGSRAAFFSYSTYSCDEMMMPNRNGDWYDGGVYVNFFWHRYTSTGSNSVWTNSASGVAMAWNAIEDIDRNVDFDGMGFPAGTRESIINQLSALVAYFYLVALDHFGGVPLYTSNLQDLQPRASDQETFDFIEQLLKDAIQNLPQKQAGAQEFGYISQGAAAMMLAQLYFNAKPYIGREMYSECETVCNAILNGQYGSYSLARRFQDIWGFNNKTCPEHIWVVPNENGFLQTNAGSPEYSTHYNTWMYFDNPDAMSWNGLCLIPSLDIEGKNYREETGNLGGPFKLGSPYAKYEDNDLRKKNYLYLGNGEYEGMFLHGLLTNRLTGVTAVADGSREYVRDTPIPMVDQVAQLAPDDPSSDRPRYPDGRREGIMYAEENSGVRLLKYSPIPNQADNAIRYNRNIPIFRLTEVQYMLAECKYRSGNKAEAAALINQVRARYFTADSPDPNPVPADFDEYRFLDEWLIEFIGEGRRRTDLIRWDKYTSESWWDKEADGPGNEFKNRLPIPTSIIQGNPLITQNPGY